MQLFQKSAEKTIFLLTCLLAGGIAAVSWGFEVLLHGSSALEMTAQCLLFFLLTAAAACPRKTGETIYMKWFYWCRRSRGHFLTAPLFILLLCSLLHPYRLPGETEEWLWIARAHLISYFFLLFILYLFGWDKNSPDLLNSGSHDNEEDAK